MHVERSAMGMEAQDRHRGNVIPAYAGIQRRGTPWIPAYAGMTITLCYRMAALQSAEHALGSGSCHRLLLQIMSLYGASARLLL